MKKTLLIFICVIVTMLLFSSCDPFAGRRPVDFPNTRWSSENPDMYFDVGENRKITHTQIVMNGEVIELICWFAVSGAQIGFDDPSGYDPETGYHKAGVHANDIILFTGLCRFGRDRIVVTVTDNKRGFLDDSITEIVFVREDLENVGWQTAYADLLRKVQNFGYVEREYTIPGSFDTPPLFYLYDIDVDGIPELILLSYDGAWTEPSCNVYTYTDNSVIRVGRIIWHWFGSIGAPDDFSEGLFSDASYKGHYGSLYYYTLKNGELIEQLICKYHFRPTAEEKGYIVIYDDNGNVSSVIQDDETGYAENSPEARELLHQSWFDFYQITEENIQSAIYK